MPYFMDHNEEAIVRLGDRHDYGLIGVCTTYTDENGESGTNYYTYVHENLSDEALDNLIADEYYATHCQHEYDCCGRTYVDKGRIALKNDELVVIRQSWHVNI